MKQKTRTLALKILTELCRFTILSVRLATKAQSAAPNRAVRVSLSNARRREYVIAVCAWRGANERKLAIIASLSHTHTHTYTHLLSRSLASNKQLNNADVCARNVKRSPETTSPSSSSPASGNVRDSVCCYQARVQYLS